MIGKHCNKTLVTVSDNAIYFKKRCQVCRKTFKQRKRLPAKQPSIMVDTNTNRPRRGYVVKV